MELKYIMGNIAEADTDAIVLPANRWLKEGYGSSEAIYKKAGRKELTKACEEIIKTQGTLEITDAYPTLGFNTNASAIIHAVVPKWIDGNSDEYVNLYMTYRNSLATADNLGCSTIAFPLLAAGNKGFDPALSLEVAEKVISDYEPTDQLNTVYLVLYDQKAIAMVMGQGKKIEIQKETGNNDQEKKPAKKANIEGMLKQAVGVYKNVKQFCIDNPEVVAVAKTAVLLIVGKKKGKR